MMRKLILASHGLLAAGMKDTVAMIIGESDVSCLSLEPGHHPDELKQQLETMVKEAPDIDFIILCDVFGGSVANALMHLCTYANVHVVTGMNLGLVISIATADPSAKAGEVIRQSLDEAKKYMLYANDLL